MIATAYTQLNMILIGLTGVGIGFGISQTFVIARLNRGTRYLEETLDALTSEQTRVAALREELERSQ